MRDPVVKTIEVLCSQANAFGVFVNEINSWWPLSTFSVAAKTGGVTTSLRMEPEVGGKIVETTQDGKEYVWGTVRSFTPPDSLRMDWHPGKPAESASLVEVRFTALAARGESLELDRSPESISVPILGVWRWVRNGSATVNGPCGSRRRISRRAPGTPSMRG